MMNFRPHTEFGKTKHLPVKVYVDAKFEDNEPQWDEVLWIERGEDWYAFGSMKGKRVRVVTREDWVKYK